MNGMHALLNTRFNFFIDKFMQIIKVLFTSFDIYDAIDILVLGLIIFVVVRFLKGRKATALLFGIAICVTIMLLSWIFHLDTLYKVVHSFVDSGPLVLVIIFQSEIRDALERIGAGSINSISNLAGRHKKREIDYNVVDNVCSAVKGMALECTGALIVIERTTSLSDVIDGGIKINAEVNSSLLRNLFFNRAPLHDGAVIISEGRIAAASCYLPLTRRNDVDSDLGTRHRAALGMSECSDAIIIVVSEETGTISVAHDCVLQRNLTPDELKSFMLENILKGSHNSKED